ncbi:MAG: glycogen/starch/alpha-glucan phosphorylase, partial [Candidatus Omnitrophica bacterium]|nr:glycogen/starch/alpha-glucan phosphorylase [Candidatus Omnitrophota bacterium]
MENLQLTEGASSSIYIRHKPLIINYKLGIAASPLKGDKEEKIQEKGLIPFDGSIFTPNRGNLVRLIDLLFNSQPKLRNWAYTTLDLFPPKSLKGLITQTHFNQVIEWLGIDSFQSGRCLDLFIQCDSEFIKGQVSEELLRGIIKAMPKRKSLNFISTIKCLGTIGPLACEEINEDVLIDLIKLRDSLFGHISYESQIHDVSILIGQFASLNPKAVTKRVLKRPFKWLKKGQFDKGSLYDMPLVKVLVPLNPQISKKFITEPFLRKVLPWLINEERSIIRSNASDCLNLLIPLAEPIIIENILKELKSFLNPEFNFRNYFLSQDIKVLESIKNYPQDGQALFERVFRNHIHLFTIEFFNDAISKNPGVYKKYINEDFLEAFDKLKNRWEGKKIFKIEYNICLCLIQTLKNYGIAASPVRNLSITSSPAMNSEECPLSLHKEVVKLARQDISSSPTQLAHSLELIADSQDDLLRTMSQELKAKDGSSPEGILVYAPRVPTYVPSRYSRIKFLRGDKVISVKESEEPLTEEERFYIKNTPPRQIHSDFDKYEYGLYGSELVVPHKEVTVSLPEEFIPQRPVLSDVIRAVREAKPAGKETGILLYLALYLEALQNSGGDIIYAIIGGSYGWGIFSLVDDFDAAIVTEQPISKEIKDKLNYWWIENNLPFPSFVFLTPREIKEKVGDVDNYWQRFLEEKGFEFYSEAIGPKRNILDELRRLREILNLNPESIGLPVNTLNWLEELMPPRGIAPSPLFVTLKAPTTDMLLHKENCNFKHIDEFIEDSEEVEIPRKFILELKAQGYLFRDLVRFLEAKSPTFKLFVVKHPFTRGKSGIPRYKGAYLSRDLIPAYDIPDEQNNRCIYITETRHKEMLKNFSLFAFILDHEFHEKGHSPHTEHKTVWKDRGWLDYFVDQDSGINVFLKGYIDSFAEEGDISGLDRFIASHPNDLEGLAYAYAQARREEVLRRGVVYLSNWSEYPTTRIKNTQVRVRSAKVNNAINLEINTDMFGNGEIYLYLAQPQYIEKKDCILFLSDYSSNNEILKLIFAVGMLEDFGAKTITVVLPYLSEDKEWIKEVLSQSANIKLVHQEEFLSCFDDAKEKKDLIPYGKDVSLKQTIPPPPAKLPFDVLLYTPINANFVNGLNLGAIKVLAINIGKKGEINLPTCLRKGECVLLVHSTDVKLELLHLFKILYALRKRGIIVSIYLPNFSYSRQHQIYPIENSGPQAMGGNSAKAIIKAISRFSANIYVNNVHFSKTLGEVDIINSFKRNGVPVNYEIENLTELAGLINITNLNLFDKLVSYLLEKKKLNKEKVIVIAADKGASLFAQEAAGKCEVGYGGHMRKERDPSKSAYLQTKMAAPPSDIRGKSVIVVDDIIDSGGTIIDAALLLKARGAEKVFVGTVYGIFSKGISIFKDSYVIDEKIDQHLKKHNEGLLFIINRLLKASSKYEGKFSIDRYIYKLLVRAIEFLFWRNQIRPSQKVSLIESPLIEKIISTDIIPKSTSRIYMREEVKEIVERISQYYLLPSPKAFSLYAKKEGGTYEGEEKEEKALPLSSSPLEDKHSPFGLLPARQRHYASINPQEFGPFRINDNRELVLVDLNLSPQELLPGVFKEHLQEMFRLYRGQAPPQLKFKIRITPDTGAFDYNSQLCRRLIEFIPALGNQEYPFLNIHPCLIYFLEEGTHDSMLILQNIIYRIYGLNAEEAENTFIDYLCQSLIGNISLECITNQGFNKHIIVEDQWIERFIQQKFVFLMQQYDNYERGTQIYSWFKANRVNPDFTGYFIQQVEKHLKEAPAPEGIGTIHMLAWLLSMPELLGPVKNCENWNNSSFSNILQHGRPKLTQDQVNNYILDTLNAVVDKDLRNLGRACLQCLRNFTEFSAEDLSWVVGNFEVEIDDYLRKLATEEGYARRDDELWKWVLEHKDNPEAAAKVKELLNDYITVVGEGNEEEKKKEAQMVLSKPQIEFLVNNLIMSQEVGLPAGGLTIDFWWARTYKKEVLLSLKDILEHCSIYSFQMEHCVERSFMEDLKQSLIRSGIGEYKAQKLTQRFAMLMMAGGLGSFKPDLTRSEHEVLKSILGEEWAKEHFAVCGVFYSKFIRGFKKPGEEVEEEVVNEAIKLFGDPVKTVEIKLEKDAVDYFGLKNEVVIAGIFKEKHLPVSQYWLVCPEIYLEIYPGENNDKWRALQSIIYREAYLRFIKEREEGKRNSLIFTMSEVNTTLVFPWVVEDKHKYDPLFAPENVSVHHYNHTIVLAGMAFYEEALFKILKISQEYNDCIVWKDELGRKIVDMAKLTARALKKNNNAWNFITGCSDIHTQKLKEEIFKDFRDLVRQDNLWRNTEGAVSKRWMGDEVRKVVNKYMKILGLREDCEEDYDLLKFYLDNDENQQVKFIEELLTAKRIQKKRFIEELKKKTFGDTGLTDEELDALIDRAFIAGARRLVDYKCADLILELLENNEAFRQRFVAAKPVLFTGGREFGEFGKKVRERAERLMSDPYLGLKGSLIFIAEHDIFTSWIIQQGADVGMIIAWKFKEAAAQSYANLMQNGGIIFVIFGAGPKERLGRIVISKDKRFEEGIKHVSKVGIIIEFNSFLSEIDDGFGNKSYERLPNPDSFIEGIEEISRLYSQYRDYSQQDSYGQWSYRSLMIGLTIGEERHQTAGIINLWAKAEKIRKREAVKGADASSAALIQKLNNSTSLISSKDLAHSPSGKDCSSPAAKILRTKAIGSPVIFPAKDEEIKAKISANPGYLGLGTVLKLSAGDKLEEAAFSLAPQGAPQEIIELKIREEKAYFRQILSELELSIGNGRVSELKREIFEEICQKKLQAYAFFEQTAKRLNLPAEDKSKIEDRLKQRYELNEVSIKSEEGKFIQILEPLLKEIDKGKIDLGSIGRSVMLKAPEIKENIRKERLPLYLCFYEAIKFYRIASPETKGILYDLVCNFRKSKEFDKNNRQEAGVYVNYFRHWADTIIEGDESLQLKAEIIKKINQGFYPDAAINLAIGGKRIEAHQRRLLDFLSFLLQGKFQDPEKIISRIQEKRGIVLAAQSLNWLQVKEYREALHLVGILSERDPGKAHWLTFTKDIPILLQGEFSFLNTGDYVAVDGEKSVVVTNLKRDTLRRYRKQIEDRLALDEIYAQRLSEPLPKNIEVKVNVGAEIEKESLLYEKLGRPLVGLVRTELLYEYLMPTLKKLVEWLSWFPGRIRLLDYQEDKDLKAFASFGQGYGLK